MEEIQPLVSVVTITRNRGKLIGRCIKSVLSQTYTNIEHIVVDGASDDETDSIVASFDDNRLKYHKLSSNWSLEKTYKYGTSLAKGEYLCFLDSDDEYMPTKVEKQLKLIQTLPQEYGMVYCWMTYFDSADNTVIRLHAPKLRGYVPLEAAAKPTVSGTPIYFFRKEVYQELGGWAWNMPIITDWEMGARCCQKWKVDYVPESLVNVYENHYYVRQTDEIRHNKELYKKRVAMHAYFLKEFESTFDKKPRSRWYHYSRMAYYSLKGKNYIDVLKYGLKLFNSIILGI